MRRLLVLLLLVVPFAPAAADHAGCAPTVDLRYGDTEAVSSLSWDPAACHLPEDGDVEITFGLSLTRSIVAGIDESSTSDSIHCSDGSSPCSLEVRLPHPQIEDASYETRWSWTIKITRGDVQEVAATFGIERTRCTQVMTVYGSCR